MWLDLVTWCLEELLHQCFCIQSKYVCCYSFITISWVGRFSSKKPKVEFRQTLTHPGCPVFSGHPLYISLIERQSSICSEDATSFSLHSSGITAHNVATFIWYYDWVWVIMSLSQSVFLWLHRKKQQPFFARIVTGS